MPSKRRPIVLFRSDCVSIDIPDEFVDDKTWIPGIDGTGCLKFRIRNRLHDQYSYGLTVYDFRNKKPKEWHPLSDTSVSLSVRIGKSDQGVSYTYVVIGKPRGRITSDTSAGVLKGAKQIEEALENRGFKFSFKFASWDKAHGQRDFDYDIDSLNIDESNVEVCLFYVEGPNNEEGNRSGDIGCDVEE